jgi:Flp pilus assembly protein TadG
MKRVPLLRLARNSRGMAIVEFGLAAPVFLLLLFGMVQLATLLYANSGLRTAVAQGARFATIYPRPSDTAITAKMSSYRFGVQSAKLTGPTLTHGTDSGADYVDITMSYAVPLNFIFFTGPSVTLTATQRAYQQPTS